MGTLVLLALGFVAVIGVVCFVAATVFGDRRREADMELNTQQLITDLYARRSPANGQDYSGAVFRPTPRRAPAEATRVE
jgi:hypothetical protein